MASTSTDQRTKRRLSLDGFTLLFGCFVGLCTLFSLVVTIGVAWQEHLQLNWPETMASIQQCQVKRIGQKFHYYIIDCGISYMVGDQKVGSHVVSQSVRAPEKVIWEFHLGQAQQTFNEMQGWVDAHPPGTLIGVHYNPSSYEKAALVATDMPLGGPQTQSNIKFTEVLAAICVALLAIGAVMRRLSARE